MHRRTFVVCLAALACASAALLPATASAKPAKLHYYLALGDSLSRGMQPNVEGKTRYTNQGYANDLLKIERRHVHNLSLAQLGCGGETTTSMLTGKGNVSPAEARRCKPRGGSQQAAAEHFLRTHHKKGEVPLVTLDIGANDIQVCAHAADVIGCVTNGLSAISTNLPKILAGLRKAAPTGTTFVAMTLYDPLLRGFFAPTDSSAHTLALASVALAKQVNDTLTTADSDAGFLTADVAGAFDTYDNTTMVSWEDQEIPINVANVCSWTWACQTPPSGPNIHANKNGYHVIANAFAKVIGNRLH
jgi:lysophospholipase L1-like esterase